MGNSIIVPKTIIACDETTAWAIAHHWGSDGIFIIDGRFYLDLTQRDGSIQLRLQVAADLVAFMDRENQTLCSNERVRPQTAAC